MNWRLAIKVIVLIFFFITFLGVVSADGDYIISPVQNDKSDQPINGLQPTEQEVKKVEFWELPLWIILLEISVMPIESFNALKSLGSGLLGYKRLSKRHIIENKIRSEICGIIRTNPGIHQNALVDKINASRGTVRYHLGILEDFNMINTYNAGGYTRYFPAQGAFDEDAQIFMAFLAQDTSRKIIEFLMENSEATREEIAEMLMVTPSTVSWYMKRMEKAGIILARRTFHKKKYTLKAKYNWVVTNLGASHFWKETLK